MVPLKVPLFSRAASSEVAPAALPTPDDLNRNDLTGEDLLQDLTAIGDAAEDLRERLGRYAGRAPEAREAAWDRWLRLLAQL